MNQPIRFARLHRGPLVVGALFLLLSLYYNISTPLWESDNEWAHYQYARYIVDNGRLPDSDSRVTPAVTLDGCSSDVSGVLDSARQFRQPPLYYILGAASIAWIEVGDGMPMAVNPHVFTDPSRSGVNLVVHTAAESFPYHGTVLAVHVMRVISGLIGLSGIIAMYLLGLLLFPRKPLIALATMAVNAFIPQYVFSSAVINNDILAGALGAWCLYFGGRVVVRKAGMLSVWLAALMAVLAVAAKYTGLALLPYVALVGLVVVARAWREHRLGWRDIGSHRGLLVLGAATLVFAWWQRDALLARLAAYSSSIPDLREAARSWFVQTQGIDQLSPMRAAAFAFMTFWGLFGNDFLALPTQVIVVLAAFAGLGVLGLMVWLVDRRELRETRVFVVLALSLVVIAWLLITVKSVGTSEPRGRYLLPEYGVISLLLIIGIDRLLPTRWKIWGVMSICGGMLLLCVMIPITVILPAFAQPPVTESTELLPGEEPLHAIFGDFAELLGYRLEPVRVGLFERLRVTLVWRTMVATPNNYTLTLYLLDGAYRGHGALNTFPGRGNYATSLWQPGDVLRETYDLYLEPSARDYLPSVGLVKVTLHCYEQVGDPHLFVHDAKGNEIGDALYLERVKLVVDEETASLAQTSDVAAIFGDGIDLVSYSIEPSELRPGTPVRVQLDWQAQEKPAADYSAFVQLLGNSGSYVEGSDQPLGGAYLPSGLWDPGDGASTEHSFLVPRRLDPGEYSLVVGLYDPRTGRRLQTKDAESPSGTNDRFRVATLTVDATGAWGFLPLIDVGQP